MPTLLQTPQNNTGSTVRSAISGLGTAANFLGNVGSRLLQGPSGINPSLPKTPQGGINFGAIAPATVTSPSTFNALTSPVAAQPPKATSLAGYITSTSPTPSGGSITMTGGNPTSYSAPQPFTINTSGPVNSDILSNPITSGDISNRRNQYLDYVNGLAQAKGYSPDYVSALQATQAAQLRNAQLEGNLATGMTPGDTQAYASGITARAQSLNSIQSLAAQQALQAQELIRQGNIAGASAIVDAYKPQPVSPGSSLISPATGQTMYGGAGAYSDYQAQQTYFNLAQNFPDAQIPAYNPQLSAQQNLQIAQQSAAKSPSFQSRNLVLTQLPDGSYGYVQKNQLSTGASGGINTLISSEQGASAKANASSLAQQTQYFDTTQRAYTTALQNLSVLQQFMQQNNINQSNIPIINQLQNKVKAAALDPGVIAAFQSSLAGLRAEYSQVLARGGARSVETDNEAKSLIPDDLNPSQLQTVTAQLNKEGANAVNEARSQIQAIQSRLAGSTSGYIDPSQATW